MGLEKNEGAVRNVALEGNDSAKTGGFKVRAHLEAAGKRLALAGQVRMRRIPLLIGPGVISVQPCCICA